MNDITIHHLGYLVKNIQKSKNVFIDMGFQLKKDIILDDVRDAYICFLGGDSNGALIELIQPTIESPIYALLKKYPNAPYHICYKVEDIFKEIQNLEEKGFFLFRETEIAPAISSNAKVAFLIHRDVGMIELLQDDSL